VFSFEAISESIFVAEFVDGFIVDVIAEFFAAD